MREGGEGGFCAREGGRGGDGEVLVRVGLWVCGLVLVRVERVESRLVHVSEGREGGFA